MKKNFIEHSDGLGLLALLLLLFQALALIQQKLEWLCHLVELKFLFHMKEPVASAFTGHHYDGVR
jgi:hypothetical protein